MPYWPVVVPPTTPAPGPKPTAVTVFESPRSRSVSLSRTFPVAVVSPETPLSSAWTRSFAFVSATATTPSLVPVRVTVKVWNAVEPFRSLTVAR